MTDSTHTGDAPDFPADLEWLNTDRAHTLADFKGKFVLLDFWTYCCINCIHVIPDLKRLEAKYPNELVVVGVHSAKFDAERDAQNIRQAILRYGIEHPVVNDHEFVVWRSYGARAWPTVVLIDPEGDVIGKLSGEGVFAPIDQAIQEALPKFEGRMNFEPIEFALEKHDAEYAPLKFPGKLVVSEGRIVITDSNNDRVVITDLDGAILDVVGSGAEGASDGAFEEATFNKPQGTALVGDALYIADTENHLIRRADLSARTVETLAGVGRQGFDRNPTGDAREVVLNSPWDLVELDGTLYVAMAGNHQLWRIDLATNRVKLHAGSGREDIIDGALRQAALAQPSGLATDGASIYFADSEVSGVRVADAGETGVVRTIVGDGLFEFGDKDGDVSSARLQHPLGVEYVEGVLYVADTYNNKIKAIDLAKGEIRTLAGTGEAGAEDGDFDEATFDEPNDVAYYDGTLYVADANNHLVRALDLETRRVSTLTLTNLAKLRRRAPLDVAKRSNEILRPETATFTPGDSATIRATLPEDAKWNDPPGTLTLYDADGAFLSETPLADETTLAIPADAGEKLHLEAVGYYCKDGRENVCLSRQILYELRRRPSATGDRATITVTF
ncbi:MAG: redoxin domain-containing protein [Ignavibacteriales bacterium]|nr:redoxin domain-containing protein [Ignavibacteriales bacterium]